MTSTTGNEFERPGVNYPDRENAAGATATPAPGEPTRDEQIDVPPTSGGHLEAERESIDSPVEPVEPVGPVEPGETTPVAQGETAPETPEPDELSHESVGIGVVDSPAGPDHHGQDEGRTTLTAGEAQRTRGGLGTAQAQRLPAMSQNDATALDKVSGIVVQTRADVGTKSQKRIAEVLRQRLEQAGVDLPDADVEELARQISTGDSAAPATP